MMKKNSLLMLLAILIMGCSSNEAQEKEAVSYVTIAKGSLHGAGEEGIEAQNLIIRNNEAWVLLMSKMNTVNKVSDSFLETTVNFDDYILVAVFDSVKNTGGHSVDIEVEKNIKNVAVNVTQTAPGLIATTVIEQPYVIAKIPVTNLPVVFK